MPITLDGRQPLPIWGLKSISRAHRKLATTCHALGRLWACNARNTKGHGKCLISLNSLEQRIGTEMVL